MSNFDMTKQAEINHKEPGMTYNSISGTVFLKDTRTRTGAELARKFYLDFVANHGATCVGPTVTFCCEELSGSAFQNLEDMLQHLATRGHSVDYECYNVEVVI